jgi:hypothetical protein
MSRYLFIPVSLLLSSALVAQTSYQWSPQRTGSISGGNNNTIPFWAASGTYQQIHDAPTMGSTLSIKGLGMRPAGNRTVRGRSWEMRLSCGHTSLTSRAPSTTFSTNLGATPTIVFGTASTWKKFSWPDFTTSGTTPAFTIPFASSYIYIAPLGNFCFEWRHKNGSITTTMPMDASSGTRNKGTSLPSTGTGCTATGKTGPATATMTSVRPTTSNYQHDLEIALNNAAPNANAFLAFSLANSTTPVGNWCAPVVNPLLLANVGTNGSGSFKFTGDIAQLAGTPPMNIYTQFAFADSGLPSGIGLSNVAGFRTPDVPGVHGICRIYKTTAFSTTNGDELATVASGGTRGYGLSLAFLK